MSIKITFQILHLNLQFKNIAAKFHLHFIDFISRVRVTRPPTSKISFISLLRNWGAWWALTTSAVARRRNGNCYRRIGIRTSGMIFKRVGMHSPLFFSCQCWFESAFWVLMRCVIVGCFLVFFWNGGSLKVCFFMRWVGEWFGVHKCCVVE
jgi:hypothetical protein